ncbi:imidazole glycerol phosphate synthase subunit HisH [Flavobacteriaceae bacterium UJ101]|nr:imidazole glycerol phosphate synthase subunit HisH [Flavobacteriaceae bacterium UJ101]
MDMQKIKIPIHQQSKIVIIDYGAGNLQSVLFAMERMGVEAIVSNNKKTIKEADKVIFPGVGHAKAAMMQLEKYDLIDVISSLEQPVLGICLGMQLLCDFSEEGNTKGLGVIPLTVKEFKQSPKIPHMGWNTMNELKGNLFDHIKNDDYVYYVHSYYVPLSQYTLAKTSYGESFSGAIQKDNFYACQFHPEKSGSVGEQILKNFLKIKSE